MAAPVSQVATTPVRRRHGDDEDEAQNDDGPNVKKMRTPIRDLVPLDCVGRGEPEGSYGNEFPWMQKLLRPRNTYGLANVSDYFSNNRNRLAFAKLFHVPVLEEDYEPPTFTSDVGVMRHAKDNISRLLYALIMTTKRSELDVFKGIIADATLPQFTPDQKSSSLLHGPMGGIVGRNSISLWSINTSTTNLSALMQTIMVQIVQASHGDKKVPMWYNITTPSTSLLAQAGNQVLQGRYQTKGNFSRKEKEQGAKVEDDVDPYLLKRIAEYRNVDEDSVVPSERQHHDKSVSFSDEDFAQNVSPSKLFSVHLVTEVHTGRHANGEVAKVVTHELRLTSELPGSDLCLMLQQAGKIIPALQNNLKELWRENMLNLRAEGHLNTENMYSPHSPLSIYYLTCPAVISLALFTFADTNGITNLDAMPRIDVNDDEEVLLYKKLVSEASDRGATHNDFISREVMDNDLNSRLRKNCHIPVDSYDPDVYDARGWHIRSYPLRRLREDLEEQKRYVTEEIQRNQHHVDSDILAATQDVDARYEAWLAKQLQCDKNVYFSVFGWRPYIGGVVVRINTDIIPEKHDKVQSDWQMPMIEDCSTMVYLYLSTRQLRHDSLDVFWAGQYDHNYKGHVADEKWIKSNVTKNIPMSVLRMHMALNQPAISPEDSMLRTKNPREYAIKNMMGVNGANEHEHQMAYASSVIEPNEVGMMHYRIRQASKIDWVMRMLRSEFDQWKSAAAVIEDLKYQSTLGAEWSATTAPFFHDITRETHNILQGPLKLDWGSMAAVYNEDTWHKLDLDVNLGNMHIILGMMYAGTTLAMSNDRSNSYGFPVFLCDGGHSYQVTRMFHGSKTDPVTIDYKTPGAGADMDTQTLAMLNMVYALHVCQGDVRKMHEHDHNKDTVVNQCSDFQLQVLGGCGSFKTATGGIQISTENQKKFGSFFHWTEMGKAISKERAETLWGALERIFAHSGVGPYVDTLRWQSTMNSTATNVVSWSTGMVLLVCGNDQHKRKHESLLNGARMTAYSSASSNDSGVMTTTQPWIGNRVAGTKRGRNDTAISTKSFRQVSRTGVKTGEMGTVNSAQARQHRVFFLVKYLTRKAFPFFAKGFHTCPPCWLVNTYADNSTLTMALETMTVQLRRRHMQKSADFERNCRGPAFSTTVIGMFIHSYATRMTLQSMQEVKKDKDGVQVVKLDSMFDNMVAAYTEVPPDACIVLSGLYTWLHNCVLDTYTMVVASYMTHTMGLRQHCSLVTIGLVMNDFYGHLDRTQLLEYNGMCAFLVELVTEEIPGASGPQVPRNPYTTLMKKEMLAWQAQDFGMKDLSKWFNHNDDEQLHQIMQFVHAKRNSEPSVYMMNTIPMNMHTKPAWLRQVEIPQRVKTADLNVEQAIMQTFADLQSSQEDDARFRANGDSLKDWQSVNTFWKVGAQEGVRFPTTNADDGKQESKSVSFMDPQKTYEFWQSMINNIGGLDGIMFEFLKFMNVSNTASRHDIFSKLLGPYIKEKKLNRRVLSGRDWTARVSANASSSKCMQGRAFNMGCFPSFGGNGSVNGVFTNLGVDVLAFLLLQAMYCHSYKKAPSGAGHTSVVHLRNNCTAAATIVELMLHNGTVPLCEVPLNTGSACDVMTTGHIIGYAPSPLMHQQGVPVTFAFNELLHVDKGHFVDNSFCRNQVLCEAARQRGRWRLLHGLEKCGPCKQKCSMAYMQTFVQGHRAVSAPVHEAEISPFPVESTAHMQVDYKRVRDIYIKCCRTQEHSRNEWAQCMRLHATSLTVETLLYRPLVLTHCSMKDEIPCIAWFHGHRPDISDEETSTVDGYEDNLIEHVRTFLFVLRVTNDTCRFVPVQSNYDNETDVSITYKLPRHQPLPLTGIQEVPLFVMQSVLGSGLVYSPEQDSVQLCLPGEAPKEGIPIPYSLFPVINYRTFVVLQCDRKHISVIRMENDCDCSAFYVTLDEVVHQHRHVVLDVEDTALWMQQNRDVVVPAFFRLVVFETDVTWESVLDTHTKRWGRECKFILAHRAEATQHYVWCNNKAELLVLLETVQRPDATLAYDEGSHLMTFSMDVADLKNTYYFQLKQGGDDAPRSELGSETLYFDQIRYDDDLYVQARQKHANDLEQLRMTLSSLAVVTVPDMIAELHVIRARRETMVRNSAEQLQFCCVKVTKSSRFDVGSDCIASAEVEYTWKPWTLQTHCKHDEIHNETSLRIGVVDRWSNENFLRNGDYRVRLPELDINNDWNSVLYRDMAMDFVTLSRCALIEGQAVYLLVDRTVYSELRTIIPGFHVSDETSHALLTSPAMEGEDALYVQFESFYILHDDTTEDPMAMGMRLLLPVHSMHGGMVPTYKDDFAHQFIIHAKVYVDGLLRVRPTNNKRLAVCTTYHIAHEDDDMQDEPPYDIVPGQSAVWTYD